MIEARPRLAEVLAAVEGAVLAARGGAQAREERARVVGRDAHVAAVGEGGEAADLHVLPAHPAVGAPEEPHAHGEEDRAGQGRAHAERVSVQHALGVGIAPDPALEVGKLGEREQFRAAVIPGFAAVEAAHGPPDLQRPVHLVGVVGVHGQAHHATGERHLHPVGLRHLRQAPPRVPAVLAPVDAHRRGARVDHLRVSRVDVDGPHFLAGVGEAEPLPARPVVRAPVGAVVGAGVDDGRIVRMHRDGLDRCVLGQALRHRLPLTVSHGLTEEPAELATRPFPCTDVDIRET